MDKKLAKLLEPGFKTIFALLILFVGVTFYYSIPVAVIEGILVGLVLAFYKMKARKRGNLVRRYVESLAFQVDNASKNTIVNFPLPMVIIEVDNGEIVWENQGFESMTRGSRVFDAHITELVPGFDTRWIMEGKTCCPFDVQVGEKKYNVYGNLVKGPGAEAGGILATLFWVDVSEYSALREKYRRTRPVVAMVLVDSHEELYKNISETEKSIITAEIDSRLTSWFKDAGGIFRKLERGRYFTIFDTAALLNFTAGKFSVLESMHEVKNSEGIPATLSIGIGKGEECSLAELYSCSLEFLTGRSDRECSFSPKACPPFYPHFRALLQRKGVPRCEIHRNTRAKSSHFDDWKRGSMPSVAMLLELADYLHVTLDVLVGRETE